MDSNETFQFAGPRFSAEAVEAIPLSLYLHWPWCVRKCPYCDFNSHAAPSSLNDEAYVDAVLKDLAAWQGQTGNRPISSVFVGGGTPSLMSGKALGRLLEGADRLFSFAPDCEITLEANPGTVDESRFADFRRAGVNRLSIGVQSFIDEKLRRLGRIHSSDEARHAAEAASKIFDNFNLDVMFALPGESLEELASEVRNAVSTGATHLSFYQLTIEEGTAFAKKMPQDLPDDDLCADMSDLVVSALARAGFEHYEVSGYAKPGRRCRHNLNYWTFGDYLAAGAGAHGKLTTPEGIVREKRLMSPKHYMEAVATSGHGIEEREAVEPDALPFEFMLNVLRLTEGVPSVLFTERTGLVRETIEPTLSRLRAEGLLLSDTELIRPTEKGMAFLSEVQEAFL